MNNNIIICEGEKQVIMKNTDNMALCFILYPMHLNE
jgi:hypothetical protein